ncbi:MAG: O-antigen ligase family protein [Candidatus Nomurabacteria bacterium]|jgi:O-antigen ligase|nr:O-antigen ligase family protein [Candidatus Nomurabacteria bacterium]
MNKFKQVFEVFLWQEIAFLALGFLVFFPYQPLIYLGAQAGANLEISILQIGIGIFCVLSVEKLWKNHQKLVQNPIVKLGIGFVLWNMLSLIWTPNKLRGLLATAIIVVIFTTFISILTLNMRKLWQPFVKIVIITAIASGVVAIWQIVGDKIGVSPAFTLLPENYRSDLFGIARPTAFFQEPQFFANMLLFPILYSLSQILKGNNLRKNWIITGFLMLILFLTLSRGAILALGVGILLLIFINFQKIKRFLWILPTVLITIVGGLTFINPKIANQLSLGLLGNSGYVVASTDERMAMNEMAIKTITKNPSNFLFGIGIGGTGRSYQADFGCLESCINFNEYLDLFVEIGLVGFVLFFILIFKLLKYLWRKNKILAVITITFLTQWLFFAGYPNSLPSFVMLAVFGGMVLYKYGRHDETNKKTTRHFRFH